MLVFLFLMTANNVFGYMVSIDGTYLDTQINGGVDFCGTDNKGESRSNDACIWKGSFKGVFKQFNSGRRQRGGSISQSQGESLFQQSYDITLVGNLENGTVTCTIFQVSTIPSEQGFTTRIVDGYLKGYNCSFRFSGFTNIQFYAATILSLTGVSMGFPRY